MAKIAWIVKLIVKKPNMIANVKVANMVLSYRIGDVIREAKSEITHYQN